MGAVDLPVHAYLASRNVTANWPPVRSFAQIGSKAQHCQTSDVVARPYVDSEPTARSPVCAIDAVSR
jgi:hypothetical protein